MIGACDLSLIERNVVDLGYMLGLVDWGKGYATEIALALIDAAFFDLRADRIISTVDVNNKASIHVLEKIGMRWEAVFRKHRRAKNRWWDCHLFVLPREVWELQTRPHPARRKPTERRERCEACSRAWANVCVRPWPPAACCARAIRCARSSTSAARRVQTVFRLLRIVSRAGRAIQRTPPATVIRRALNDTRQ